MPSILRLCHYKSLIIKQEPNAAIALVSARPTTNNDNNTLHRHDYSTHHHHDSDLARADTLLQLHQTVKLAYSSRSTGGNLSRELGDLLEMRSHVRRVLHQLTPASQYHAQFAAEVTHDNDDDETEAWS